MHALTNARLLELRTMRKLCDQRIADNTATPLDEAFVDLHEAFARYISGTLKGGWDGPDFSLLQ